MSPKDNMVKQTKLENLSRQLCHLKELVSDSTLMTNILMTLSNNNKHIYSTWDSRAIEDKTLWNFLSRLMFVEVRKLEKYP